MDQEQALLQILATRFPHIPLDWLERIDKKLGLFIQENGGNVEMRVRFNGGEDQWTDWSERDFSPKKRRR